MTGAAPRRLDARAVDRLTLAAGLVASSALTLWLTWGIWATGLPTGDDTSAHVLRADYAIEHFFNHGQLDGWQTSFGLGYQEFLWAGPGFSILVALVKVCTLGAVSTVGAFKIAVVLSFVTLPFAMAFLAWSFGLGLRAAGVAAPLTWVVSNVFGGAGLEGVFVGGLVPNQLASTFFCLALGGLVLVVRRPSARRVVFTAAAMALTLVTHPIAAYILAFFVASVLIGVTIEWFRAHGGALHDAEGDELVRLLRGPRRRVLALAATAGLAFGFSAATLIPIWRHPELRGENSDWADLPLLDSLNRMVHGTFLIRPGVALVVVAGWVFLLRRARSGQGRTPQPLALTLVLTPLLFLLMGRVAINTWPDNIVAIQMTNRGFGYAGLLALLPLAALVAAPRRPATSAAALLGADLGAGRVAQAVNALVPVALALAIVVLPAKLGRETVDVVRPTPAFSALAAALPALVPEDQRFVTQREPSRERQLTGMSHPDLWLATVTRRDTLNIFNLTSSTVFGPVYEGEQLTSRPPGQEAETLARLGITHVALIDTTAAPGLLTSPRFHVVWRHGDMAILEVLPAPGQPDPRSTASTGAPATAIRQSSDPEHFTVSIHAEEPTAATIAVAWSPKWTVTRNGETVPTTATTDKLLQVPVGAGDTVLTFRYGPDGADAAGRLVTMLTVVLAGGVLVRDRRARRARAGLAMATAPAALARTDAAPEHATATGAGTGTEGDREAEIDTDEPAILTVAEAAAVLRVPATEVERLLRAGAIPGRRIGEDWRLSRLGLLDWLAERVGDEVTPRDLAVEPRDDAPTDLR